MIGARTLGPILAASLLAGCSSISNLGLARTLDRGQVQFAVAPEVHAHTFTTAPAHSGAGFANLEGILRYGLSDTAELGVKLTLLDLGLTLDGKFAILRSDGQNGFDLALDPGVGAVGINANNAGSTPPGSGPGLFSLFVSVPLGFDLGGHELVLAPRILDQVSAGSQGALYTAGSTLYLGASLGFALKCYAGLRVMPEVSVAYPIASSSPTTYGYQDLILQAGVGFLFGRCEP